MRYAKGERTAIQKEVLDGIKARIIETGYREVVFGEDGCHECWNGHLADYENECKYDNAVDEECVCDRFWRRERI